ncbi:MAG: hypothetical protein ACJ8FY_17350 [Gemmataceae bacterium]
MKAGWRYPPCARASRATGGGAYYFDHQPEIEAELGEEQCLISQSRKKALPTPIEVGLRAQGLLLPS